MTSTDRINPFDVPADPDWAWLARQGPDAVLALGSTSGAPGWARGASAWLARRLRLATGTPPPRASDPARIEPLAPSADLVPIVGRALHGEAGGEGRGGALDFVRFGDGDRRLEAPGDELFVGGPGGHAPLDARAAAEQAIAVVSDTLAELMPEATRPTIRVETRGDGASLALAVGLGALFRILRLRRPDDLIATGAIGPHGFVPVDPGTLAAKAAVARAWGYRRLAVVEGQEGLENAAREGVEIVALPGDPAELPLAVHERLGLTLGRDALVHALSLFDLRVARRGPHQLERVLRVTAPLVDSDDPVVRHVACDLRSRLYVHAGESIRAREWLQRADACRGEGDLPDGRLRDVLRYQQAAHRSIVHLDTGEWGDEHPAHVAVDVLIDELDARWCTTHERLMRLFLANTRARRHEYVGRFERDERRIERAWTDAVRDLDAWAELIEAFARRRVHLVDTTLERQRNLCVDIACSRALISPSRAIPDSWRATLDRIAPVGEEGVALGTMIARPTEATGFDLIAAAKRAVIDEQRVIGTRALQARARTIAESDEAFSFPDGCALEWLAMALVDRASDGDAVDGNVCGTADSAPIVAALRRIAHDRATRPGILAALAHRALAIAARVEGPSAVAASAFEGIASPASGASTLDRLRDALASDRERAIERTPY